MRRPRAPLVVVVFLVGVLAGAAPGGAQAGCSSFSTLASAAGLRVHTTTSGRSLADPDGHVPGAQAEADSVLGTRAWAGAPYSAVGAENAARATDPNQLPVIATTSYPATPEVHHSTPAATIDAKSEPTAAAAKVVAGVAPADTFGAGRIVTAADAGCRGDSATRALADTSIDLLDVAGVLRIGSVRSHASAVIDATGRRALEGTMDVEGASVLGIPVSVTDRGVAVGSSPIPMPDGVVSTALVDAGITVRYVAVSRRPSEGDVTAPGLEIEITREIEGYGTGPVTVTIVLGRAYARAAAAAADGGPPSPDAVEPAPADATPASGGSDPDAAGLVPAVPSRRAPVPSGVAAPAAPRVRAVSATAAAATSTSGPYTAIAIGTLVLLVAWVVSSRRGAKVRWS